MFFQPHQVGHGGRQVGKTGRGGLIQPQLATGDLVKQDQWHRVQGVRGFGLVRAVGVQGWLLGFFVQFVHLVGIAVVGGDQGHTTRGRNGRQQARQSQVNRLYGHGGRAEVAGVAHHVAIGEVAAQQFVLATLHGGNHGVGDLG